MSGSAGFLSLEVKLDLDRAESGLKDLARFAKAELGQPIRIDPEGFRETAKLLSSLESSYADTLAIVTKMNASTVNLARSTRAIADAARYANGEHARSVALAKEQERTKRATLALEQEQVKAAAKVGAVEAANVGKLGYVQAQTQAAQHLSAEREKAKNIEREHRALMNETAEMQRAATAEATKGRRAAAAATRELAALDKEVLRGEKLITEEIQRQAKQRGLMAGAFKTATSGIDWGVTAVGAAQARNYGYAVGALINAGRAAAASLSGLTAGAAAATAGIAALAVAAVGAAAGIGALAVSIARAGTQAAVGMESLVNQLNAMLPTAQMAKDEIAGIFELGTRTIAPTQMLIELDRRLLMAGGSAAQMRQKLLEGYSAFSTAAGLTTEQMNALNYLIGEVTLKGRLMRTELSQQFSSANLSSAGFLEATAKQTGIAVDELNKKLSDGTFTADMFVQGLIAYFSQFESSADAALMSVSALSANIKDQISAGLAQAFYNSGVTAALSSLLLKVQEIVTRIQPTFERIGAAVNLFFTAVSDGMGRLGRAGGTDLLVTLFGRIIPAAITIAAQAVQFLFAALELLWPSIMLVVDSVKTLIRAFGGAGGVLKSLAAGTVFLSANLMIVAGTVRVLIGFVQGAVFMFQALWRAMHFDFAGASSAAFSAVGAVAAGFMDAAAAAASFNSAVKGLNSSLKKTPAPKLKDSGRTPPSGMGDASGGSGRKSEGGGKKGGGTTAAARALTSALNELWDQTRRWLGLRSELEQSLMGGLDGFTATADQIIDTGIKIAQTLDKAGYSGKSKLVRKIKAEVMALAKLAQQREALQKKLEEQQQALQQLQDDRASMSVSVAQSLNDFVFALTTEQETIQEWTRLDAVGSFVVVQRKQSKSWVVALKDRLAATKKFVENIRALKKKGLNAETIRQLVEAGPEAAAAAVAELTAGGDETIRQVNAIQDEMAGLSEEFGDEQASNYYDAGIAAAQALVDGTRTAIDKITAQADAISKAVRDQLAKIAVPAKEAGSETGAAYAAGVGEAIDGGLAGFSPSIPAWNLPPLDLGDLDFGLGTSEDFEQIGRDLVDGLWNGIKETFASIFGGVFGKWIYDHLVRPVMDWLGIASPSTVFFGIGVDIVKGLWNGLLSLFTNNPVVGWVQSAFSATLNYLTVTLPASITSAAATIWSRIKTGWPNIPGWIASNWAGVKTYLTVTLPNSVVSAAGTIWSKLKSGWPDMLGWLKSKWASSISWLKTGLPAAVKGAIGGLTTSLSFSKLTTSAKDAMKAGVNAVLKKWNGLTFQFPSFTGDWNGPLPGGKFTVGGFKLNTPNIPLLAKGGLITAPTLMGAGEAGAEAVLPLTNQRAMAQIADAIAARGATAVPEIHVFIGDQELTDIVDVRVGVANGRSAAKVYAGRGF